ncbi:MAG: glycosyltransferase [Deltaproteobacteria bacterium]|jgi:glycosyltransferase involved in cell wall biosynthesis|nr:glycosyltransferase [Deltaproteobacteria bacterium]
MNNQEQKLRIIQVVNVRWVNATAWYALFLSRLLARAGHEVLVLGLEGAKSFALAEEWGLAPRALPLNSANPFRQAALYADMAKLVRDFQPQVVNCHRGESFALWALLRSRLPRASRYGLVRTRGDQRPIKNNFVNRRLYAGADALIATNSRIAVSMERDLGADASKVFTILGGVDKTVFYPDPAAGAKARQKYGFAPDDFVVGLLGRLDPVKGHAVLIEALARLRQKHGPACAIKFFCLGDDSHLTKADLRAMLEAAGLADQSVISGRVDDVAACLNALDLGVLASVSSEAIARAALEIMACGVPLLSSDVGVMPDLLPLDRLTPAGDAAALALALERYRQNRDELEELRSICQRRIAGLKSGDFLTATLDVYRSCLSINPTI